ncbi:pre-peptidase C-terminal domain-containing protein [Nodosilinea sp. E11]|uniref:pre-peptidase C-terminal domain-containing protein n=1 Tax=Nodosilinea sp. E11 TaxID=3037479 RepID=UPI00293434D0|nr:pre-peptidase C-terminal domain-containing protein [Nodosilinea sp. E11]WOD40809.1 pre-peptidase C-terminal domain-containing protein [Nodosilinea sp. E11]
MTTFMSGDRDEFSNIHSTGSGTDDELFSLNSGVITSAFEGIRSSLHQLALSSNAFEELNRIFEITNLNAAATRLEGWAEGVFSDLPDISVLSDEVLGGALGAYSADRNTIYLAESLMHPDSLTGLTRVLLEEYGHALDQQFNSGGDTAGDEGELFSMTVLGEAINAEDLGRIRAENDWGLLNLDGTSLLVEFDNSLSTAVNLGTLSGSRSLSGFVGSTDPNDYYRFNLTAPGDFRLTLNGLSADADVQLLNSSGSVIQSSTASGTTPELITRNLSAGTYYARVFPFSGDTNYNLSLTIDQAGNSLGTARNIGNLSGTRTYTDFVGSTDPNDYYRFNLTAPGDFQLTLNGLSADADVQLLNSSGSVIQSSTASGTTPELITRNLSAGTYYARVLPFSGDTNYNLSLTIDQAGNSLGTARNIGNLRGTRTYTDFVGSTDPNDYYRFNLTAPGDFQLTLNGLSADADVQLLNSSGSVIQSSTASGTTPELITRNLSAGTYYARVLPFNGDTNYNLSLTIDQAGNSLGTARNIGNLSGTRTYTDFVGNTDPNDYYRFSLSSLSNFNASLTGLSANADIRLIQDVNNNGIVDSGDVLTSSTRGGNANDALNVARLGPGNYFVNVSQFSGNTNYTLRLSTTPPSPSTTPSNLLPVEVNLGALSSATSTRTGAIGDLNTSDIYAFTVGANSNLNAVLTGVGPYADVDIRLLRDLNGNGIVDAGEEIARSQRGGSANEAINLGALSAGAYFMQVYQYSGNSNYTLSLDTSLPSNFLTRETEIGPVGLNTQTFTGNVSASNTTQLYRFNLNTPSTLNASLTGLTSDVDIRLIRDANNNGIVDAGEEIARSQLAGSASELISRSLAAGVYYMQVYRYSGASDYSLALNATPPDRAGNTLGTARAITVGATPSVFNDFVGSADTNDYYRFTLGSAANLNLALTGLTADADIALLNSSGTIITSSTRSGTNDDAINYALNAGTYYVRVYPFSGNNTNYRLLLSTTPIAPTSTPSNLLPTETNIGTLGSSVVSYSGTVGSTNTSDVYRFVLGAPNSPLNLQLTGVSGGFPNDIDLRLIRDANNNGIVDAGDELARSTAGVGGSESISLSGLGAGAYFAQVYQYNGSSNYTLSLFGGAGTRTERGTLGADSFTYVPGYSRSVFLGNGNVDYQTGARDELVFSDISSTSVVFNYANTGTGGVIYNPGNGNRVFDALTLSNGARVLFEGIERLRFADRTINLSVTPNDPLFNNQWNLHMMGVHNAWRFTTGSSNVQIGVQDTGLGVDANNAIHPDLRSTTIYPNNYQDDFYRNFTGPGFGPKATSHGTPVQGIIAAATNNGVGMSGINWNSPVIHIDVLDGNAFDQSYAEAAQNMINVATQAGRRLVINMSLSGGGGTAFEQLIAANPNVLFVIASGNDNISSISYPSRLASQFTNVMAIGASWGRRDTYGNSVTPGSRISYPGWWGSNYGTGLTLMGPSEVTATTATRSATGAVTFGYTTSFNGTSAATPDVTGVASLVWSANQNLTATQVRNILSQTAYDLGTPGYDTVYGNGFVNADAAVRRAMATARGVA